MLPLNCNRRAYTPSSHYNNSIMSLLWIYIGRIWWIYFIGIAFKDDFSSTLILFMGRQFFKRIPTTPITLPHTSFIQKKKIQLYFSFPILLSQQCDLFFKLNEVRAILKKYVFGDSIKIHRHHHLLYVIVSKVT